MINVDSNELQKLYIAYFGRPGDPSGIKYWLSRSKESLNIKEISNELSRQDEYTNYFLHDRSFDFKINRLYLNLFNRKADFEGLNYWMEMINKNDYLKSKLYYDSALTNINREHNKYNKIKIKSDVLTNLVKNLEIISLNDSLIELTSLSEEELKVTFPVLP